MEVASLNLRNQALVTLTGLPLLESLGLPVLLARWKIVPMPTLIQIMSQTIVALTHNRNQKSMIQRKIPMRSILKAKRVFRRLWNLRNNNLLLRSQKLKSLKLNLHQI